MTEPEAKEQGPDLPPPPPPSSTSPGAGGSPRSKAKGGLFDGLQLHESASHEEDTPKLSNKGKTRVVPAAGVGSNQGDNMPAAPPFVVIEEEEAIENSNNASSDEDQRSGGNEGEEEDEASSFVTADQQEPDQGGEGKKGGEAEEEGQEGGAGEEAEEERSMTEAPVTDKLLGLLDNPPSPPSAAAAVSEEAAEGKEEQKADAGPEPDPEAPPQQQGSSWFGGWFGGGAPAPAAAEAEEATEETAASEATEKATAKEEEVEQVPEPVVPTHGEKEPPARAAAELKVEVATAAAPGSGGAPVQKATDASVADGTEKEHEKEVAQEQQPPLAPQAVEKEPEQPSASAEPDSSTSKNPPPPTYESPPAAAAAAAATTAAAESEEKAEGTGTKSASEQEKPAAKKPAMNEADRKEFEEAFHHVERASSAMPSQDGSKHKRGTIGQVAEDTPVPHSDVCLRLLRKFAAKTRPKIVTTYGGSKPRSIITYLLGSKEDAPFVAYREFIEILFEGEDPDDHQHQADGGSEDDPDHVVSAVLGASGDDMIRARAAVAAFVNVVGMWGHASSRYLDEKVRKTQEAFSELLAASIDAAAELVAHGCLDGVQIQMGNAAAPRDARQRAVYLLAQSVFNSDLTLERNELAALKFLLTTGCRVTPRGDALLRGSHLLQTIRTLYHVYLTTESTPNKTTARAALQQLVTSVFTRVVQSDADGYFEKTADNFPSENHRDAFLVLRSICKLSMRSLPDPKSGLHSHVGLQSSGSGETWDAHRAEVMKNASDRDRGSGDRGGEDDDSSHHEDSKHREPAHLLLTAAIHPALESKLLALELLLYVLQHTEFSRGFIQRCGPQFHVAIRNYLCVSLLKNCTSDDTRVVNISLRIFVPLVRNFRSILKNEIEAFVTNVFFVIVDSANTPAEHKSLVVKTFDEICSDPSTLAEIFLNYDCDLSAVDLFHRIVNTLSKVSRAGFQEPKSTSSMGFMGGPSAARMEKFRNENRELRLEAMRAMRQVLASLHASIVEPMDAKDVMAQLEVLREDTSAAAGSVEGDGAEQDLSVELSPSGSKQNLVEIYDSKKRRRAEEAEAILRFNQKPSAGIAFAAKCKHVDGDDPVDVARYLLKNKDVFDKTQIGEYLGREPDYQKGFSIKVLHEYVRLLDLADLLFDEAIRYFLSGFRLPGEAQKIDRIMEKFAERYTEQNPDVFPTADSAFILAFSVIMLNTDLHNPAIKEDRRMTKEGFIRNNRGICDGQDLPDELLNSIFDRIKSEPISLKEDEDAREKLAEGKAASQTGLPAALSPASFFTSHYDEMDRARESNFQKERDHIVRTTESLLKRRRHSSDPSAKAQTKSRHKGLKHAKFVRTEDSGLRDEYVSPMFEVTWGPALASFSTAMESANGTIGALIAIASDEELELAAENAAETIEVCLTGFRFAICTAGLCGNDTARDAYVLALSRFTQLGTGALLEPRHVRCIQTLMSLAKDDGELLGNSWQYVFRSLSEINRFHQLFQEIARNNRAAAAAAARRQRRLEEKEKRRQAREQRRAAAEDGSDVDEVSDVEDFSEADDSLAESDLFSDPDDFGFEEDMDARAIDEANARVVYDAVSEALIDAIYSRSASFSPHAVKDFVTQLCLVSQNEISVRGGHKGDLNQVNYRQHHAMLSSQSSGSGGDQFHHTQPNIYNLQKLVEVTHYNMESRPRLIFSELWSIVAEHLTGTALHSNPAVAMYAVDSFRQLSIQYLQREELEVFEFQRRFLKPLEVVMGRSSQSSTKELLLNCVDRIIRVFKADGKESPNRKGGLRSGWVPILIILGLGGRDANVNICAASFHVLVSEIKSCLDEKEHPGVLLSEHFVETVNALLMYITGPHEEVSLKAFEQLALLADYLADDTTPLPQLKRKASSIAPADSDTKQDLELWWPILLGLSESVGDDRLAVRSKALETLVKMTERYFFPPAEETVHSKRNPRNDDIQNLQLIFRGILYPIVEFAEFGNQGGSVPSLPSDFERFLTAPKNKAPDESAEELSPSGWLETTFDPFMDACVTLCLRSISVFKEEDIVDEVFAILNACLLADSGMLAVKGLHRLEQFVTSDLDSSVVTDDIWATVSHMLRRCLAVRGLPSAPPARGSNGSEERKDEAVSSEAKEYAEAVREFTAEDSILRDRRYVGSNATNVIGLLLSSDHCTIGLRWKLFLIAGVGHAIVEWERAASILGDHTPGADDTTALPPKYEETALYGRKWMNRFLLQLASMKEVVQAPPDADVKVNRFAAGQKLVLDETQRLLAAFLKSESGVTQHKHPEFAVAIHKRLTSLVSEILAGYSNMDEEHLKDMEWINSILLGSCIQSRDEKIRLAVQKLVQRTSPSPNPYPFPPKSESKEDAPKGQESTARLDSQGSSEAPTAGTTSSNAPPPETPEKPKQTPSRTGSDLWNPMSWFGSSTPAPAEDATPAMKNEGEGAKDTPEEEGKPVSDPGAVEPAKDGGDGQEEKHGASTFNEATNDEVVESSPTAQPVIQGREAAGGSEDGKGEDSDVGTDKAVSESNDVDGAAVAEEEIAAVAPEQRQQDASQEEGEEEDDEDDDDEEEEDYDEDDDGDKDDADDDDDYDEEQDNDEEDYDEEDDDGDKDDADDDDDYDEEQDNDDDGEEEEDDDDAEEEDGDDDGDNDLR